MGDRGAIGKMDKGQLGSCRGREVRRWSDVGIPGVGAASCQVVKLLRGLGLLRDDISSHNNRLIPSNSRNKSSDGEVDASIRPID